MTMDADVDVPKILKEMTEVSGADIKSIVTEAGMFAIRRRSKSVSADDFDKAIKKVLHKEEVAVAPPNTVYA